MPDGRVYSRYQELKTKEVLTEDEKSELEKLSKQLEEGKNDLSLFYSIEELATKFD